MDKDTLYEYMNWPEIETIVYSEHDNPHQLLGPHNVDEGTIVNAFLPGAKEVTVKVKKSKKGIPYGPRR